MVFPAVPRDLPKRRTGKFYDLDGQKKPIKVYTGSQKALRIP